MAFPEKATRKFAPKHEFKLASKRFVFVLSLGKLLRKFAPKHFVFFPSLGTLSACPVHTFRVLGHMRRAFVVHLSLTYRSPIAHLSLIALVTLRRPRW